MKEKSRGLAVTWLSFWLNIMLGVLKCSVGIWVNSKALIADGLHSLVDLSTDLAALVGLTMAAKPQDENHPYGHHKFASLSTLFIAATLLLFCAVLIYTSIMGLVEGRPVSPEWPALLAAGLSLAIKEWLFWRTRSIAKMEKSQLLMANAWHHRTDSISSLLVFIALLAVSIGGQQLSFLDKSVGIILGAWMGVEGMKMLLGACNDLLDTAPREEIINDLREHVMAVDGVQAYHQFRVRRVGDMLEADVHIQVDASLTVEAGHDLATKVRALILENHPEVVDLLVHVEPAVDEHIKDVGVSDLGNCP
ncbi:cation diffusion facilitator family transporter [Rubellicoccus peritrichatus]|uniref:Cation diffusion facilitator family transporter n=1 Tax=Rubellicoccus peritrichatus TaxID=3080537 RepID=A0AAQ3QSR7_9BACT|nr:cation diffusion facilitator family transporter [Puniceicoccus sp. CR14]WOO42848.1 cation diffusion facilitator family transporter [Puniceicoccus sp. CR14]